MYLDSGFYDDYALLELNKQCRRYFALTLLIQIIKLMKFTDVFLPKTALFTSVLKRAASDLIFFMYSFTITLMAFAFMFMLQMGPVLGGYDSMPNVSTLLLDPGSYGLPY